MRALIISRDPRQERGFEEARNRFYDMFQVLTLHQQYGLGECKNLMIHHYEKSWYLPPDGVDAEHLIDFIDSNEPLTEDILIKLTGMCTNA